MVVRSGAYTSYNEEETKLKATTSAAAVLDASIERFGRHMATQRMDQISSPFVHEPLRTATSA